jgi:hypothetical protein
MANQIAPLGACTTCDQLATTRCAGCADTDLTGTQGVTLYRSKEFWTKDWSKHKAACQAAQGRKNSSVLPSSSRKPSSLLKLKSWTSI